MRICSRWFSHPQKCYNTLVLKKLTLIFTSLILLFSFFPTPALAQTTTKGKTQVVESNRSNPVEETAQAVIAGEQGKLNSGKTAVDLAVATASIIPLGIFGYNDPSGTATNYFNKSAISSIAGLIGSMYAYPPAGATTYIADVLDSAHIVEPAYAQGLGFASLSPILETWKVFRNVAYFFFIVIFLVIGFMIMFRQKLGGQTAITAQQAIPRIIIALLAVTFSYAIAGVLIEIMYLVMYMGMGMTNTSGIINYSIFQMGAKILGSVANPKDGVLPMVASFIENAINLGPLENTLDSALGGLGGLIVMVVIALAILIALFRLFFELLKTYVSIILNIVLAPVFLMMTAIPGNKAFGSWLKGLIGDLSAFPTVLILLIVYDKIAGGFSTSPSANAFDAGGFTPPFVGGSEITGMVSFVLGLAVILILPDLVKEAKKMFGGGSGLFDKFGGAFADSVKRGWSGGELIPGIAATNTAKWGEKTFGGISGGNFAKKLPIVSGMLGGGGLGLATSGAGWIAGHGLQQTTGRLTRTIPILRGWQGNNIFSGTAQGARRGGRRASDLLNDPNVFKEDRKARQERTKNYTQRK